MRAINGADRLKIAGFSRFAKESEVYLRGINETQKEEK